MLKLKMRFFPDGPSIPNALLEARDAGEVVFLCGAGVSIPAGLPDFRSLAKAVIDHLAAPETAESRALFELENNSPHPALAPSMDQIFGHLQNEYGAAIVEQTVANKLRRPRKASLEYHTTILRLSTDTNGLPRVVTTNFDTLFQAAGSRLSSYQPPHLPDLTSDEFFHGIVHLHGGLFGRKKDGKTRQGLVLSVADFGRAYLADGWATRFMRRLLERSTIVLLGYRADDPPMRYLLEGLRTTDGLRDGQIYAFDEGEQSNVDATWRDRGVNGIAYPESDKHAALWDSLSAWANRASNPEGWRESIVDMACQGPRALAPYQRGQVAALCRSAGGAETFAKAEPPPPAEWLCVLDPRVRYANPGRRSFESGSEIFDPLEHYGLDDDHPRPEDAARDWQPTADDLLRPLISDGLIQNQLGLQHPSTVQPVALSSRLLHLGRWIGDVSKEPAALWWAAGYGGVHEHVRRGVEIELSKELDQYTPVMRNGWRLLLECSDDRIIPTRGDEWDFPRRLKQSGWSASNLRAFRRVFRPRLKISRPWLRPPRPPEMPPDDLHLRDLCHFEVDYRQRAIDVDALPDETMPLIVKAVRVALEHGESLEHDIERDRDRLPTLHPEDQPGERYLSDRDAFFLWYAKLFEKLRKVNVEAAKRELTAWPHEESLFFGKLRVWAWVFPDVASSKMVAEGLLALDSDTFWDSSIQRELLWTLRGRWQDFTLAARKKLEARLVSGRRRWRRESDEDYALGRAVSAAIPLSWLHSEGVELSQTTLNKLDDLKAADPMWRDVWTDSADESLDSRGGWVRPETDPRAVLNAPISEVLARASRSSGKQPGEFVNYDPFRGLVEQNPRKALLSLTHASRQGEHPGKFWETLLSAWPDDVPVRMSWLLSQKLAQLPSAVIAELRHYAPDWLKKHLPKLADAGCPGLWKPWDSVCNALEEVGDEATKSSIAQTTVGGVVVQKSRRTYGHAINSPVGKLVECLIGILSRREPGRGSGIPNDIRERAERALGMPSEGANHAVSILSHDLNWLDLIDRTWANRTLVPIFDPSEEQSEAAWSGFVAARRMPQPKLFHRLKAFLLRTFSEGHDWDFRGRSNLSHLLVLATDRPNDRSRLVSFKEARSALQLADDKAREDALYRLHSEVQQPKQWRRLVKPFLTRSWPQEKRFQTEATSRILADLAAESGQHFPEVVDTIHDLLVPAPQIDLFVYHLKKEDDDDKPPIAAEFPMATLKLLGAVVPDDPQRLPWDLRTVLDVVVDADPALRQNVDWRRLKDLATQKST